METYEDHRKKIDKQRQLVKEKADLVSFSGDAKKKDDDGDEAKDSAADESIDER